VCSGGRKRPRSRSINRCVAAASLSIVGCAALLRVDGGEAPRETLRRREVVDADVPVVGGCVSALGAAAGADVEDDADGTAEVDAAASLVPPGGEAPAAAAEVAGATVGAPAAVDPCPLSSRAAAAGDAGALPDGDDAEVAEDDDGVAPDVGWLFK
jgi:hypothetical protein